MKTMMTLMIQALLVGASAFSYPVYADTPITVQIPDHQFAVLAFHDERESVLTEVDRDPYAISTSRLANFFDWIQQHHLQPVSLTSILDAEQGKSQLPKNAILLTFDDGPESNYTQLFPLLKSYQYPALLSLQTGWISGDVKVDLYGKEGFVTWDQLREMKASGLVEFATHTHNLHLGILANPQGNVEPAAIIRRYDPATKRYETDAEYTKRIRDDLSYSADLIQKQLGVRPIAVVWPYGAMNEQTQGIAKSLGLPISFSLGFENINKVGRISTPISRVLVTGSPTSVEIEQQIDSVLLPKPIIQRAVEIDLDQIYDPDPEKTNIKLSQLLDRIKAFGIQSVYLKAFSDPEGTGIAYQLYFPNRHLPVKADLFNRVSWQLRTRAGVKVYAVLPLLTFHLSDQSNREQQITDVMPKSQTTRQKDQSLNLFLPETRQIVGDIYEDLGKNSPGINGILINGDIPIADTQNSASCLSAHVRWPQTSVEAKRCSSLISQQKARALLDFSDGVVGRLMHFEDSSAVFNVAWRVTTNQVLDAYNDPHFGQNLGLFVQHFNEVVVMVPPYQGDHPLSKHSLLSLVKDVAVIPNGLSKVTFELSTKDAVHQQALSGRTLRKTMEMLTRSGAKSISYYSDDFINNTPAFDDVYPGISLNSFPEHYKSPKKVGLNPSSVLGVKK